MFPKHHLLLAAAAAVALTVCAQAENGFVVKTDTVSVAYGDLDLGTEAGARTMLKRIETAAKHACGIMPERDRFYRSNQDFVERAFRQCTSQSVREAVARLHAPLVTHAYAVANGVADTDIASH